MKLISKNELKEGKKYYFIDRYEHREYIGIITDTSNDRNKNFNINILDSYDPRTNKIPHIGYRFIIFEFLNIYEVVLIAKKRIEQRTFDIIMNNLIPGFNIKYL